MIRRLPPDQIRAIAAGEVVSAPVDVLKELIENALDAGADRLDVTLQQGGCERIVVRDNGVGIARDDLPLAVEAHSTSKLASLSAITTLGFRGEGLYAIRYAARLAVTSRPAQQLGGATLYADGDDISLDTHPAAAGTICEVTELFGRLPARRQGLEPPANEGKRALALLSRYLLHHPHLSLKLVYDGEERWSYAGGSFYEAVKLLWGTVSANRLLSVTATDKSYHLHGLLSRPELSRPRRDRLLLAVNGRPVEWPDALIKVVIDSYQDLIPGGQYPVGVLNLSLPADEVLVNTAPDKRRVRLLSSKAVAAFVEQAVADTLGSHTLAPALPDLHVADGVRAAPRHRFPHLRQLGRYRDLYLLAEADGDLWVVDQHAAHERILFEELARRYRDEPPVELPHPELLPLSADEIANYEAHRALLGEVGLELEPFGPDTYRLRRVPAFLVGHPDLAAEVVKSTLASRDLDQAWRHVLARLACLPAIKAGHALSGADAQTLLDTLATCDTPWACPHGRPTALVLSELDLARRFGRRHTRQTQSPRPTPPNVATDVRSDAKPDVTTSDVRAEDDKPEDDSTTTADESVKTSP